MQQIFSPTPLGELPKQSRPAVSSVGDLSINLDRLDDMLEREQEEKEKEEKEKSGYKSKVNKIEDKLLGVAVDNDLQASILEEARREVGLVDGYFDQPENVIATEEFERNTAKAYLQLMQNRGVREVLSEVKVADNFRAALPKITNPDLRALATAEYEAYLQTGDASGLRGFDLSPNLYKDLAIEKDLNDFAKGITKEVVRVERENREDGSVDEVTVKAKSKKAFDEYVRLKYDNDPGFRINVDAKYGGLDELFSETETMFSPNFTEEKSIRQIENAPSKSSSGTRSKAEKEELLRETLTLDNVNDPYNLRVEDEIKVGDDEVVVDDPTRTRILKQAYRRDYYKSGVGLDPEKSTDILINALRGKYGFGLEFSNGKPLKGGLIDEVDADLQYFGQVDMEGVAPTGTKSITQIRDYDPKTGTAMLWTNNPAQLTTFADDYDTENFLFGDNDQEFKDDLKDYTGSEIEVKDGGILVPIKLTAPDEFKVGVRKGTPMTIDVTEVEGLSGAYEKAKKYVGAYESRDGIRGFNPRDTNGKGAYFPAIGSSQYTRENAERFISEQFPDDMPDNPKQFFYNPDTDGSKAAWWAGLIEKHGDNVVTNAIRGYDMRHIMTPALEDFQSVFGRSVTDQREMNLLLALYTQHGDAKGKLTYAKKNMGDEYDVISFINHVIDKRKADNTHLQSQYGRWEDERRSLTESSPEAISEVSAETVEPVPETGASGSGVETDYTIY